MRLSNGVQARQVRLVASHLTPWGLESPAGSTPTELVAQTHPLADLITTGADLHTFSSSVSTVTWPSLSVDMSSQAFLKITAVFC